MTIGAAAHLYSEWLEDCEAVGSAVPPAAESAPQEQPDEARGTSPAAPCDSLLGPIGVAGFRRLMQRRGLTACDTARFCCPIEEPSTALAALLQERGWTVGAASADVISTLRDVFAHALLVVEPIQQLVPQSVAAALPLPTHHAATWQ